MPDETDFGDAAAIAELKAAGKDSRWSLTDEETTWAKALKQALAESNVEPPATDFELYVSRLYMSTSAFVTHPDPLPLPPVLPLT